MEKKKKLSDSEFMEFFIDELQDIYGAEQSLTRFLPELYAASSGEELQGAFERHTKETRKHIEMLERTFYLLGEAPKPKPCEAMEGLMREASGIIKQTEAGSYTRDAGLILAAQKIAHYTIATYGTLRIFARHMGENGVSQLLDKILENNKKTDVELTLIAENHVNALAVAE